MYVLTERLTKPLSWPRLLDLHLSSIVPLHKALAEKVKAKKPDAILITGDAIDSRSDLKLLDDFLKLLIDIPKVAILVTTNGKVMWIWKNWQTYTRIITGSCSSIGLSHLQIKGLLSRILVTGLDDPLLGNQKFGRSTSPCRELAQSYIAGTPPATK